MLECCYYRQLDQRPLELVTQNDRQMVPDFHSWDQTDGRRVDSSVTWRRCQMNNNVACSQLVAQRLDVQPAGN